MSKGSDRVKKWRENTKAKIISGYGGKCNKCGYNACMGALDLHHLDPKKKSFGFGKIMAHPQQWEVLVEEAKKCILLCSNCHRELHCGFWEISQITPVEYKETFYFVLKHDGFKQQEDGSWEGYGCVTKVHRGPEPTGACEICQEPVYGTLTCSKACAAQKSYKTTWPSKAEYDKLRVSLSRKQIADSLGISEAAVRKHEKKYYS